MRSKTTVKRILCLVFAVMLVAAMIAAAPMASASGSYNEKVERDSNGVLQIKYEIYGVGRYILSNGQTLDLDGTMIIGWAGTAFMINDYTALTCAHVVNHDDVIRELKSMNIKTEIKTYVLLSNNVEMPVTVPYMSVEDDFAILTLKQSIGGKEILKLGYSNEVKSTQKVYSLGFPAKVTSIEEKNNEYNVKYGPEDVTITEGNVQKVTNINNSDVIQHGSIASNGNSGGPLVDENGIVVGVNKWREPDDESYFWACGINQIVATLDNLKIPYTRHEPNSDPVIETKAQETVAETKEETKAQITESETTDQGKTDDGKDGGGKMGIIIAIIALVVILIIILVVVIVMSSKKKNNNNNNLPPTPPAPPTPPVAPSMPSYTPPTPPVRPQPPVSSGYNAMAEGAGETSVLNEGSGETTVLGGQRAGGFTLVRKTNGQKVAINKADFTIGKERRRVDFCISDNNSISRAHARIKVRSGKCYICDLGSTNCTFVNGSKLTPNQEVELHAGDSVKFADEEFTFEG